MTTVTFDTHASVKRLIAAGMTLEQAEAVVEVFRNARALQELATKDDLVLFKAEILAALMETKRRFL